MEYLYFVEFKDENGNTQKLIVPSENVCEIISSNYYITMITVATLHICDIYLDTNNILNPYESELSFRIEEGILKIKKDKVKFEPIAT